MQVPRLTRVGVQPPAGAVLSVPMPSPREALAAVAVCAERGIRIGCFRPPSTPDGISRLRITAHAHHTSDEMAHAAKVLSEVTAPLATSRKDACRWPCGDDDVVSLGQPQAGGQPLPTVAGDVNPVRLVNEQYRVVAPGDLVEFCQWCSITQDRVQGRGV